MLMRIGPRGLRADAKLDDRDPSGTAPRLSGRVPVSYSAFCCDHWTVYRNFGAAAVGSALTGTAIARAALHDLGEQWDTALRSPSPAAHAWDLFSRRVCERRVESGLHHLLDRAEADALVLRYKLGLSSLEAGHAMGLAPADFEMLRHRALRALLSGRAR
ncbi:hypothetical protein [Streptomyces sp. JNUCC 63]